MPVEGGVFERKACTGGTYLCVYFQAWDQTLWPLRQGISEMAQAPTAYSILEHALGLCDLHARTAKIRSRTQARGVSSDRAHMASACPSSDEGTEPSVHVPCLQMPLGHCLRSSCRRNFVWFGVVSSLSTGALTSFWMADAASAISLVAPAPIPPLWAMPSHCQASPSMHISLSRPDSHRPGCQEMTFRCRRKLWWARLCVQSPDARSIMPLLGPSLTAAIT